MKMNDNKTLLIKDVTAEEYEAQCFMFSSRYAINGLKSCILESIDDAKENMTSTLLQDKKINPEDLQTATDALMNEYSKALVKPFQRLEKVIKEFFNVPSHIILPEDLPQLEHIPETEEQIDKEIEDLKHRLKRARFLECFYNKHIEKMEQIYHVTSWKHVNDSVQNEDCKQSGDACHLIKTVADMRRSYSACVGSKRKATTE